MKRIFPCCVFFLIALSALGVVGAIVSLFLEKQGDSIETVSMVVGIVGTAASIVLSVVTMIYSNKSSKDAEKSLEKITDHYATLCKEITNYELQRSIGKASIDRIIETNQQPINKDC